MNENNFINKVIGKPWKDRACNFETMDCWGLVVLYYRHVLKKELHDVDGYESGKDFISCYEQERVRWNVSLTPVSGCLAVFYYGEKPAHVGVMVNNFKCLHSRGALGFVRLDNVVLLSKVYSKVEFLIHV